MATIDLKLKSYDELQFEIMRLNTDNYLKQQQISQLTNNWNELKEWLKEQQEFLKETPTFMGEIYFEHKTMNNTYQNVLDKMKEIKEGNK